jgi:hypothetical protein
MIVGEVVDEQVCEALSVQHGKFPPQRRASGP